jgi:uncharacterized protein
MAAKLLNPARLDVAAYARARGSLAGSLPLASLPRLQHSTTTPADGLPGDCPWQAEGLFRQPAGDAPQLRLHLRASARVWLTCQRCLQPAVHELQVDRTVRFVPSEEEAARLDEESEEDVLALPQALDLPELIEDELILALPIVPRHEECPEPLSWQPHALSAEAEPAGAEPAHPFAALAKLRRG